MFHEVLFQLHHCENLSASLLELVKPTSTAKSDDKSDALETILLTKKMGNLMIVELRSRRVLFRLSDPRACFEVRAVITINRRSVKLLFVFVGLGGPGGSSGAPGGRSFSFNNSSRSLLLASFLKPSQERQKPPQGPSKPTKKKHKLDENAVYHDQRTYSRALYSLLQATVALSKSLKAKAGPI